MFRNTSFEKKNSMHMSLLQVKAYSEEICQGLKLGISIYEFIVYMRAFFYGLWIWSKDALIREMIPKGAMLLARIPDRNSVAI